MSVALDVKWDHGGGGLFGGSSLTAQWALIGSIVRDQEPPTSL